MFPSSSFPSSQYSASTHAQHPQYPPYPQRNSSNISTHNHNTMGHHAEIIIPGSFVVLQGSPGDGVVNTMDRPPPLPLDYQSWAILAAAAAAAAEAPFTASSFTASSFTASHGVTRLTASAAIMDEHDCMDTVDHDNSHERRAQAPTTSSSSCLADSFVVVVPPELEPESGNAPAVVTTNTSSSSSNSSYQSLSPTAKKAVEEWNKQCRQKALEGKREWQDNVLQTCSTMANHNNHSNNNTATANININNNIFLQSSSTQSVMRHPIQDHLFWRRRGQGVQDFWWLTSSHGIAVLRDIPTQLSTTTVLKSVIGSLSPGSTIVATDIVYLDSHTLQRIPVAPKSASGGSTVPHCIYPRGRMGWITLLKIQGSNNNSSSTLRTNTRSGYVVLNIDGYPLLAPGLPSLYTDPTCWIWRVLCPAGAFVREGLDLHSNHLETLPYGTLVRVLQRTINSQGLCRLRITALVEKDNENDIATTGSGNGNDTSTSTTSPTTRRPRSQQQYPSNTATRLIDGWCSEFLNPLSGNRGKVLEPLSFPVPALYQVTLATGAVVRSNVELSTSPVGRTLRCGEIIPIVGRAFSECNNHSLERFQLANGGWISHRLNRPPPHDTIIVVVVVQQRDDAAVVDSTFDPEMPALYHWKHAIPLLPNNTSNTFVSSSDDARELSSVDSDAVSSTRSHRSNNNSNSNIGAVALLSPNSHGDGKPQHVRTVSSVQNEQFSLQQQQQQQQDCKCLICLTEDRNATIVHGETGHVACCLTCARILKARGDRCPVCRLPIDLIIQQFWA